MRVLDWYQGDSPSTPDYGLVASHTSVVILRRGNAYRGRCYVDPVYARDAAQLRCRGVVVWSYLFPDYSTSAPATTAQVENHLQGSDGELSFLDVEFGSGLASSDRARVAGLIEEYVAEFARRGQRIGVYSSHVQMSDSNALGGVLAHSAALADCPVWLKVPYPAGAGQPISTAFRVPHEGAPDDYWRVPAPFAFPFLVQTQGDVRGLPGIHQADAGYFSVLQSSSTGTHVSWAQRRLGAAETGTFDGDFADHVRLFQAAHGLQADGIIGPRTFEKLVQNP